MGSKMNKIEKFDVKFSILRFAIAIIIALAISILIISTSTTHPLMAAKNLFIGPLTTMRRFSNVIEMAIPLTFAGLAISVLFSNNQFNLAAEGGFFLGGLFAAIIVIHVKGNSILVMILAMLVAGLVGMITCLIPGILKVKLKCSELVVSLMLNYVALYIGTYIFNKFAKDPNSAYKASYAFRKGIGLGRLIPKTRMHSGLIIVIIFVIICHIFLIKSGLGLKMRMVGKNLSFSKYVGLNTVKLILLSQVIGGFIAGIGGSTEILGMYKRFQWSTLPGYGFDGIVLYILANEKPLYIPLAAMAVAYVRVGADYMYKQSDVASEIVAIIEALIIILIASKAFLSNYRNNKIAKLSLEGVK